MNRRQTLALLGGLAGLSGLLPAGAVSALAADAGSPRAGAPPPARNLNPLARKTAVLVLDPGHGGRDPGATGATGVEEKTINLAICREMQRHLATRTDIKVVLTRTKDVFIPLGKRVEAGTKAEADLFVSMHADAAPSQSVRGMSVYSLSEQASDDLAKAIAQRENAVDRLYGVNLKGVDEDVVGVLFDLARRHSQTASIKAKRRIVSAVDGRIELLENPMRSANFAVLRSPQVPSLLVEAGFISNRTDEKLLTDPVWRARTARRLADEMAAIAIDLRASA